MVLNQHPKSTPTFSWRNPMSKERNSRKETLKKPALSLKEKRALKKANKNEKHSLLTSNK
jgi:hypothetical protein